MTYSDSWKIIKKFTKLAFIVILLIITFSKPEQKIIYKDKIVEKNIVSVKPECLSAIEKDDYIFDEISKYFGNISSLAGIGDINAFFNGMTIQSNKLTATISSVKQERNALVLKCKN